MFDHLNWWQILVVLAPLVAVMQIIKYRELRQGETSPSQLTLEQKSWVLLTILPPGLMARLMARLEDDELSRLIAAGELLKGHGRPVGEAVLKEYFHKLPARAKRGESPDMLEKLVIAFEHDQALALHLIRTGQPLPLKVEPLAPTLAPVEPS